MERKKPAPSELFEKHLQAKRLKESAELKISGKQIQPQTGQDLHQQQDLEQSEQEICTVRQVL